MSLEQALTFAARHHDRASRRRLDPGWVDEQWAAAAARVLVVHGDDVQVTPSGSVQWLTPAAAPDGERYLLGVDASGAARFAVAVERPQANTALAGLRSLVVGAGTTDADWLCHAVALSHWHRTHRFCPRCGVATEITSGGAERRCPSDGSTHFPRVDPAVIMLVTDESDRILLGRQGTWPPQRFSTLAGFVEPGETAEQAVVREVAEEASVHVQSVQLLATQPWPFPSSLMIGAAARAAASPDPRPDGDELAEVRWFSRADLQDAVAGGSVMVPGPISISRWLIDRWFGAELPDDRAGWR